MSTEITQAITPIEIIPAPPTSPAIAKLEALIERGRVSAKAVVDEIYNEQPLDFLVKGNAANFSLTNRDQPGLILKNPAGGVELAPIHQHALGQAGDRVGIPRTYIERLRTGADHAKQLLIHNFNQLYQHDEGRYLVRVAHREVRGFLSDRYRRMDSRPVLEAFVKAAKAGGAEPYTGVLTDTSFSLKAILPVVHEPVPGEALAFGLELCSSDYGTRALTVSLILLRIRCANLAVFGEDLRKVHLGSRIGDDAIYSERTHSLDTATICSAITDIVGKNLLPDRLATVTELIRRSAEEHVNPTQLSAWMKKNLSKAEAEAVTEIFISPDIERLPQGQTRYRFSQAISWVAGTMEGERKLDLEQLAGRVLAEAA
jgi:hypothetical protein